MRIGWQQKNKVCKSLPGRNYVLRMAARLVKKKVWEEAKDQ